MDVAMTAHAARTSQKARLQSRGQATVEYILMLLVALSAFLIVARTFVGPGMKKLGTVVETQLNRALFKPGNLHQFRLGK